MRKRDRAFVVFAWASAGAVLAAVAALVGFVVVRGAGTLGPRLLFGETAWWEAILGRRAAFGGLWASVVGTVLLVVGATAFAVPTGIASGIYLAEFARGRWRGAFNACVDLLSGVPSILMGLFGFTLILFLRATLLPHANTCLLLSMICIGILVLPYLVRTTEAALFGLPDEVRLVGPSLGLSRWQAIRHVKLPAAGRGILSGVILAIGRAAEDTAVILLTGVVANAGIPGSLTDKFEAIPFAVYFLAAEHRTEVELDRAFGAALILLVLTTALFVTAHRIVRRLERRWGIRP